MECRISGCENVLGWDMKFSELHLSEAYYLKIQPLDHHSAYRIEQFADLFHSNPPGPNEIPGGPKKTVISRVKILHL